MRKTKIFAILTSCLIIGNMVFSSDTKNDYKTVDVHLRFGDNIKSQILAFNNYLEKLGIFKTYGFVPFLQKGNIVHLTLYQVSLDDSKMPEILDKLKKIASEHRSLTIKTTYIDPTPSGFTLLEVKDSPQLQAFCDEVINTLKSYRDPNAEIPGWAASMPDKVKSFKLYGSPNAGNQFDPHFSILATDFKDKNVQSKYQKEIKKAVADYKYRPIVSSAVSLGIGYVDEFGQMEKAFKEFPLKSSQKKTETN